MPKISEGEINGWTRQFLRKNNYKIISSSNNADKLFYRTEKSNPPKYKQPDTVALNDAYIIILEDKIHFLDLFKSMNGNKSDVDKLKSFISDSSLKKEFMDKVDSVFGGNKVKRKLLVGCTSLEKNIKCSKRIPANFIYISVKQNQEIINVTATLPKIYKNSISTSCMELKI
jgi:hypothetical protein